MRLIAHRGASAYAPANTPEAVTAAATHGATSVLFHDPGAFVHPCFDVFPDPLVHVTPVWLERARRTGAGIIAWNTTTAEMADSLIELGVDGICADADPAILVDALARRATPSARD
ncbi:hypothetical protein BH23ACT3_BH23ACT3_12390 [soil metagenome]